MEISYDQFRKVNIRVGTIKSAKINKKAHIPAIVLEIDFGNRIGIKKTSAQITDYCCM
tara:strand:- start:263 stop:436 length:174 start_codon:yes stop_codon:yes gene_type:complete